MAVYIAAHKAFRVPDEPGYIPLQVGAEGKADLGYTPDNTGDHISAKNPHYCELTGVYWVWKNTADPYKGLVHYRRYFRGKQGRLTEPEITDLLSRYHILLPRQEILRESAYEEFCLHSGYEKDLIALRQAVETVDAAVLPAYDAVMAGNRLHLYNMLITSGEEFDAYCAWLFAVLGELEKTVDMTGYTPYQQRLYGFLSERLLNVWVTHRGLRVKVLKVYNTEQTFKGRARLWLRRQKNRILFKKK
ncbi:MAG: DUF4422 domain-containing protein [Ruminococcaceae bacterium]|nr:DUF4422 domain-containing protein [Oscillospiraceae bacterium]